MSLLKIGYQPGDARVDAVVEHLEHEDAPVRAGVQACTGMDRADLICSRWEQAWPVGKLGDPVDNSDLFRFGVAWELAGDLLKAAYSRETVQDRVFFAPGALGSDLEAVRGRFEAGGLKTEMLDLSAEWLNLSLPPGAGPSAFVRAVQTRLEALEDYEVLLINMSVDAFVEDPGSEVEADAESFALVARMIADDVWDRDGLVYCVGGSGSAEGDGTAWIWGTMIDVITSTKVLKSFT